MSECNINAGNKLREIRESLCLSRPALQERYNFSKTTIQNWENGNINFKSVKFISYLEFLKSMGYYIDIHWLMKKNDSSADYLGGLNHKIKILGVVKLLEKISSFCYYVDKNKEVLYFNKKSLTFLVSDHIELTLKTPIFLQDICDPSIYNDCLQNYTKAINGEDVIFDYPIQKSFMFSAIESQYKKMIYTTIPNDQNKANGVFAFFLTTL